MALAIFDLDNTLIGGDSDYLWGEYLVELGIVQGDEYRRENDRFYEAYMAGVLDIYEFLAFQLRPLAEHSVADLERWRREFLEQKIRPILLPRARALIEEHRAKGRELLIITATNSFITAPIAAMLDVPNLLATEPERVDGRYTGGVSGVPCFAEGKVVRLNAWLETRPTERGETWFYSDSRNDIPLLERVAHPVAVDPDDTLRAVSEERGWPVISLR